jgi:hypothetical protein
MGTPCSVAGATMHLFWVEFVTNVKVASVGPRQLPVVTESSQ